MPFRHAHWWILALFPVAALAFWPNYLSKMATSPPSFHFHGLTASMWLILLAIQSYSIQHGHRSFHRTNGLVSFALFPLFMAGGAAIFLGMADRFAAPPNPFYELYPARLAWLDFVAIGGLAYFYHQALKYRRFVGKHASHLLATAIFLMPPILGRLAPLAMGVDFTAPTAFVDMHMGFHWGNIATAAIAFLVAWRSGRNGRPFAVAGILVLISSILFEVPGGTAAWEAVYRHTVLIPDLPFILAAALAAMAVGWAGWTAGKKQDGPASGAEAA